MKNSFASVVALIATTPAAFAVGDVGATPVPEISALEGTAALAVVACILLLVWERRRRAS